MEIESESESEPEPELELELELEQRQFTKRHMGIISCEFAILLMFTLHGVLACHAWADWGVAGRTTNHEQYRLVFKDPGKEEG